MRQVDGIWFQLLSVTPQRMLQRALKDTIFPVGNGPSAGVGMRRPMWDGFGSCVCVCVRVCVRAGMRVYRAAGTVEGAGMVMQYLSLPGFMHMCTRTYTHLDMHTHVHAHTHAHTDCMH